MNVSKNEIVNTTPAQDKKIAELSLFPREQLRDLAMSFGIKRGRNKAHTITNIILFEEQICPVIEA